MCPSGHFVPLSVFPKKRFGTGHLVSRRFQEVLSRYCKKCALKEAPMLFEKFRCFFHFESIYINKRDQGKNRKLTKFPQQMFLVQVGWGGGGTAEITTKSLLFLQARHQPSCPTARCTPPRRWARSHPPVRSPPPSAARPPHRGPGRPRPPCPPLTIQPTCLAAQARATQQRGVCSLRSMGTPKRIWKYLNKKSLMLSS